MVKDEICNANGHGDSNAINTPSLELLLVMHTLLLETLVQWQHVN
jgi:hypothetical protein